MEFLQSPNDLRDHYKPASTPSLRKEMRGLDKHARHFLANSPFVLIGSSDAAGHGDVTPKGDRPGFVLILDDRTIAIPDRPGNNRLDTLENILENPTVGLLFLIPGMDETLRVNGRARITVDVGLRERLAVEGRPPLSVIVVAIDAVYMHCAKAFRRSDLWKPESWPPRSAMPTLGAILKDQIDYGDTVEDSERRLEDSYRASMW